MGDRLERSLLWIIWLCGVTWMALPAALAANLTVDCDAGEKFQERLKDAKPGDTIQVKGACNEGVRINSEVVRVTLDGGGAATIKAPQGRDPVFIRGRDITVRGFTLTGGRDGVHLSGQGAGASAVIERNIIRETGRRGIHLDQSSIARIGANTIENVASDGINVVESSNARIGYIIFDPLPNTIRNVGGHAVVISGGSTARILGNVLAGNKGSGIVISRNSQADLWANMISGNGGDAVAVSHGSGIVVTGATMPKREGENSTDPAHVNEGYGVSCVLAGYVDGPVGKLTGKRGGSQIDGSCTARGGS